MPLDPKFETSAGLQRFREQIQRENRCRLFTNARPSPAARQFVDERNKRMAAEAATAAAAAAASASSSSSTAASGSRGQAGRSGVVSSTQRHVIDEGYDMVLKTEWGAATEGVCAQDPTFRELNAGTTGAAARSLHCLREESARRVNDTRVRLLHEKAANQEWTVRAHHIVDDGWARARAATLSSVSVYSATCDSVSAQSVARAARFAAIAAAASDVDSILASPKKHGVGLASAGVRAPTFAVERHARLTEHMRGIYERPPAPRLDAAAALEHITRSSLPRRCRDQTEREAQTAQVAALGERVDAVQAQVRDGRAATVKMADALGAVRQAAAAV